MRHHVHLVLISRGAVTNESVAATAQHATSSCAASHLHLMVFSVIRWEKSFFHLSRLLYFLKKPFNCRCCCYFDMYREREEAKIDVIFFKNPKPKGAIYIYSRGCLKSN
jgi:hypothetical protein